MVKQTRSKRKASNSGQTTKQTKSKIRKTAVQDKQALLQETNRPALPPAWRIGWSALQTLRQNKKFFAALAGIFLLLDLLLVRSVTAFDAATLKSQLSASLTHGVGVAVGGFSVFSSLFTAAASGTSADKTGAYHFFLVLLMSLATIWSLRQIYTANKKKITISIRAAFYESTAPLIPFILLIFLIGLQFIPLLIWLQIYSLVVGGGIAATTIEQLFFLAVLLVLTGLTLFWLTRSIVALYVVTLPGMLPMQALKNAKELVRGRRMSMVRKILFLPLALFILAAIVMIPTIIIWAPLAQWLFFVLTAIGFILVHAYFYTLYRELLNE